VADQNDSYNWNNLLSDGLVEYIDAAEEETVSFSSSSLPGKEKGRIELTLFFPFQKHR